MALPEDFIEQFYPVSQNVSLMGKPLASFTKKDLAATIAYLLQEVDAKQQVLNELCVYQTPNPSSLGIFRGC